MRRLVVGLKRDLRLRLMGMLWGLVWERLRCQLYGIFKIEAETGYMRTAGEYEIAGFK